MEIVLIGVVAALASLLTFFSGFGLGTILTPVLVIFFPVDVAIALSGIVHLLNNLFKITITGKQVNWKTGLKFGLPAIIGAFAGAELLMLLPGTTILYSYSIGQKIFHIAPMKLIISILMIVFALFEVVPYLKNIQFKEDKLYIGGLISGFFGGLSGNQGALRSAFLLRCGLTKEGFIATGIMIACLVDFTRLSVYFSRFVKVDLQQNSLLLTVAVLSAFAGAYFGSMALKKITMRFIQWTVTIMIFILAAALGLGFI
jgi:uncharacterized membrane protein YfcA